MTHQALDPTQVHDLLAGDPEYVFVDVRSVQEFEHGHVPGSYNIPLLFMGLSGMQPNPDFLSVVMRHFTQEQKIVFG